jgi:hypothetical protein
MRRAAFLLWAVGGCLIGLGGAAELGRLIYGPVDVTLSSPASMLNPYVLEQIEDYPQDGSITYLPLELVPTSMGITRDIRYMGQLLWQGDDAMRAHCIGLMFEIYIGACEAYALQQHGEPTFTLPGVDLYNVRAFQRDFYGVGGNERTLVEALVSRDLGQEVSDPDLALPGDFIQMWAHSGWGHSAVFLGWVTDEQGDRTGIRYWSVQRDGLGEDTVPLTEDPESVWINPERVFFVRATLPELSP